MQDASAVFWLLSGTAGARQLFMARAWPAHHGAGRFSSARPAFLTAQAGLFSLRRPAFLAARAGRSGSSGAGLAWRAPVSHC